jgi:cysteine desulfurase / selenocysteine lyase
VHYLDFAATSAVRPPQVADAVHRVLTGVAASPGRGGYAPAVEAGRIAFQARRAVARLLGLPGDPGRVTFTLNATHALNTAIHGVLAPGDSVVVTPFDHNAVLRPAHAATVRGGGSVRMIPGAPDGALDLEAAGELLEGARLLVVNATSNVLGTVLPLEALSQMARERGVLVLVDGAQSAGCIPQAPAALGADLFAFTGHKSLLGPQGIGGLWVREGVEVRPFLTGGTGGDSTLREMPDPYPDHLEAGTPNAPGMAGLLAGCEFVRAEGVEATHVRKSGLKIRLHDGLSAIRGVRVLSPKAPDGAPLVTFVIEGISPAEGARRLESEWQVLARSGLQCAPEVHRLLGTEVHGALRLSLGWCSTAEDVDQALRGVESIASSLGTSVSGSRSGAAPLSQPVSS